MNKLRNKKFRRSYISEGCKELIEEKVKKMEFMNEGVSKTTKGDFSTR